ncbi:hypothetical protein [Streptomyces albipurpureus]|uniref:Heavy metal transporter n=1 Tax=Streptomyces albipurpureus TaxID=2897419 RepID=A0ABT0UL38_9ACTN|nr:hypothetical protein [Streptomyces sp. CWNU-1]MCM2389086.1 hypothetical protein [Streptomyces sp. CWNU-1]
MPETASSVRRGRLPRSAVAFSVLLAVAGYVTVQYVAGDRPARCVVRAAATGDGPTYELSTEMASNAATISAVGTSRGLPERAVTIALATAIQESSLLNIRHGDRDSLGLFQQRPSKGWGTPKQILDPVYSTEKFYDGLVAVPGYSRLPLTVAAQRVQRSGFPQAYAKHEPNATLLAAALTGRTDAALTCAPGQGSGSGDPAKVRAELLRAFGPEVAPKAMAQGAPGASGAAGGSEVSIPVPPALVASGGTGGKASQRGWELAHWAVARADGLRIEEVSYGGKVWRAEVARESGAGWRAGSAPGRGEDGGAGKSAQTGQDEVRIRLAR